MLKTRLQLPGAEPGLLRAAEAVWEERGVKGFLAGIGPRLVGEIYFGNTFIFHLDQKEFDVWPCLDFLRGSSVQQEKIVTF